MNRNWFCKLRKPTAISSVQRMVICIPTNGTPTPGFTFSLSQFFLALRGNDHPLCHWDIALVFGDGSVIHDNREKLVDRAMLFNATHVLFIDDDMVFSPDAILSLVNRNLPLVACNYARRKPPHYAVASHYDLSSMLSTTTESTGVVPAHGSGFGMVLIARAVFSAIPKPWFLPTWDAAAGVYNSEDIMFFRNAAKAGFQLFIDQDASKLIGHCSERVLSYQDITPVSDTDILEPRQQGVLSKVIGN